MDTKNCVTPIYFCIPFPESEVPGRRVPNIEPMIIVMTVKTAHIIFYDVIYYLKTSKKNKASILKNILERDPFFKYYKTSSIYDYINLILRCKFNKIFDAQILY